MQKVTITLTLELIDEEVNAEQAKATFDAMVEDQIIRTFANDNIDQIGWESEIMETSRV